ncbi:MAG: arsenate reductase (glutaredoxin) [Zetaproteobacteria bacterium]|nr:MAG: arsenate reductase (glutaredoxin) [Zetaproteobacteria bacterium]
MVIFHNPRCSKSRQTLALLREAGIEPKVVEYLKTPPTPQELEHILDLLGMDPEDIMRRQEADYKAHFKGRQLDRHDAIRLLTEYPKVIERPIVIVDDRTAAVCRPPEKVLELLNCA